MLRICLTCTHAPHAKDIRKNFSRVEGFLTDAPGDPPQATPWPLGLAVARGGSPGASAPHKLLPGLAVRKWGALGPPMGV